MTEVSLTEYRPESVDISAEGGDTLIVTAPAMGPGATLGELVSEEAENVRRLDEGDRLADVETTGDSDLLVVPSLYESYVDADTASGLEDFLDSTTTVTASVAPHELDWLLCSADSPLGESHLRAFDRIVELRYDPADQATGGAVEAAVDAAVSILDTDPDRRDVRADLSGFEYDHEYESTTLADVVSEGDGNVYGPTLTPGVATYLSTANRRSDASALPPEEVTVDSGDDGLAGTLRDAGRDLTEVATGSLGVRSTNVALAALLGGSASAAAPAAGLAAVGFAGWAIARGGGDDTPPALFDLLQQGRVPPPTRARIEAEAGLQPGTVELLDDLATPSSLRQLHEVLDDAPEVIEEIEAVLDATEADELSGLLEDLADRTSEVGALYDEQMAAAAKSLDALAEELQSDEAALLGPVVDRSDIDPDEIPWVEVVDDEDGETDDSEEDDRQEADDSSETDADDTAVRTTTRREVATGGAERPETIREIVGRCLDNSVVVLRGGHGTGKTTVAYRAGRALEDRGYTVRVPGFDASAATVKHRLQQDAGDDPVALVVSYEREMAGESLAGEFGTIQSWIEDGLVDTVLVECREEFYEQFEDETPSSRAGIEVIGLERFDDDESISITAVVRWVREILASVGAVGDDVPCENERIPEATREEIIDLAAGNSEVAKVAAKFAFAADYSLDKIHTHEELIRDDIDHLVGGFSSKQAEASELLFDYLGIAGTLRTRDLWQLDGLEDIELKQLAQALSGYLGREVCKKLDQCEPGSWGGTDTPPDVGDVRWTLSPSLYRDVTFRAALTEPKTRYRDSVFKQQYLRLHSLPLGGDDAPPLYRNVATNFWVAHKVAQFRTEQDRSELPERRKSDLDDYEPVPPQRVREQASWFVSRINDGCDPSDFIGCITRLSLGLIPVDSSIFDDTDRVFEGAMDEARIHQTSGDVVLANILGRQIAARVNSPNCIVNLATIFNEYGSEMLHSERYNPGDFLSNVYSIAISEVAESYNLEEVDDWVGCITEQVDTVATDDSHDLLPARFVSNVYSMAISNLSEFSEPNDVGEWLECACDEIAVAASYANCNYSPEQLLSKTHGMIIAGIAKSSDPEESSEWLNWIAEQITTGFHDNRSHSNSSQSLLNVYQMAIGNLAEKHTPAEVTEWLEWITERVDTIAADSTEGEGAEKSLPAFYARVLTRIARPSHPGNTDEWLGQVNERAVTTATEGNYDDDVTVFLLDVYSIAITRIVSSDDQTRVTEWLEAVREQMETVAIQENYSYSSGHFLKNVYSRAINRFAGSSSPEEASGWIDEIYGEVTQLASSDCHSSDENLFLADCCANILLRVTPKSPAVDDGWHEDVLGRSLNVVPPSALDRFYTMYALITTQFDVSPLWQSWIVTDCLDRTIRAADPIIDEPRTIAASVVGNTLFGPAANYDEGLATLTELPDRVAQLVTDDPAMFTTLVDDVQARYADKDVSDLVVNDPDSTDFDAVGQRVLAWVRGRAMVHALTDSETPHSIADDIHEAAVEAAEEASEPNVPLARFYVVALVGLAAESDPEMASTHDELLDSALRRDTIDSCGFCIAYFYALADADSYLPDLAPNLYVFEWHCYLADSLLTRATNGFDGLPDDPEETGEMIARMLAGLADATYSTDGPDPEFHTLLNMVADHDLDAAVTEYAVQRVPELLADEYTNVLAQLDWEERFDHVV